MDRIQEREFRSWIHSLSVLLIEGKPIATTTILFIAMATGLHRLSQQNVAIVKAMAGIDMHCSDKMASSTSALIALQYNAFSLGLTFGLNASSLISCILPIGATIAANHSFDWPSSLLLVQYFSRMHSIDAEISSRLLRNDYMTYKDTMVDKSHYIFEIITQLNT